MTELTDYIRSFKSATTAAFGIGYDTEEAMAWFEADATVDQAVEWLNHGAGPGDFAGCADKEGAWT